MHALPARLTEGSVSGHLLRLTVPMVWGVLAIMAFNVTDTWFVAQLGVHELAAMSFTFPVIMVYTSLGIGFMAGTSSVLARAIGEADHGRMQRLAIDAIALALLVSLALSLLGLLTLRPLFRLLGASDALLPLIADYMGIWYAGYPFLLVPMAGIGAIRATGDSRVQSGLLIGAALINLILDPLLIFGLLGFPRLELQGAAIATVLARLLMFAAGFYFLHFRLHMLVYRLPAPALLWASWKSVLHVGLPAAGTNVIIPVATGVIVAIIADYGAEAVAGFGVATRIEGVSLVVFYAMSAIIGPFVGQNLGAGKVERVAQAMRTSVIFCLALGAVIAILLALGARPLTRLFNDHPQVVTVGALYLWTVPWSYGAAGIIMVVNAAFNGLGKPLPAVAISITRMLVLYVPLAYLGAKLFGVNGVFAAATLANVLVGTAAWLWSRHVCEWQLTAEGVRRS